MSYVVAISGPARTRAKAEVALETKRLRVLPDEHHAVMNWRAKFPSDTDEWITVEADHPDEVVAAVEGAKWRLRVHYEMPPKPKPVATVPVATLEDMHARIAALEARVG